MTTARLFIALLLAAAGAAPQEFRIYVGQLSERAALVAWGRTTGVNTIGRTSPSYGQAELRVGDHRARTDRNWAEVKGLAPDTEYDYEVTLNGRSIGGGRLRTWPEKADRLTFFAMGDYGTGDSGQNRVAAAMWREFQRREAAGDHVRFVITTGDNIYADLNLGFLSIRSGGHDSHWESKFFRPYAELLRRIPFLPTIGNHDGNSSESRADLDAYLDNFFFPDRQASRWYRFSFGGLADFFALDTSENTESGPPRAVYTVEGEQFRWLRSEMERSAAPWKIPYLHYPMFNAGPRHPAYRGTLGHFFELFRKTGVAAVFSGHEHNLQFSERNADTGGMLFVVTGAGGSLRAGNVQGKLQRAGILGWAPQRHFLVVEIAGRTMTITPLSYEEVVVRTAAGTRLETPVVVTLPASASQDVAR